MKKAALALALVVPMLLWSAPMKAGGKHHGGGTGTVYTAEGAVGHALGCLPCNDTSCEDGSDFFDSGVNLANTCDSITCGSSAGNSLVCGGQSYPQPRVDLAGLYYLWQDSGSQGSPSQCFGNGILGATVQAIDKSGDGQIQVRLFFSGAVDKTLPGRCYGATNLVSYGVTVDGCTTSTNPFPPAAGDTAEVTVSCGSNAPVSVQTQGGGGIAKQCGCDATGTLVRGVDLHFKYTPQ